AISDFPGAPFRAFFLQAEDGIRCFHVTGVQTCALPIYVIKLYFGIGVPHQLSLEDIGDHFGLTRERVRQIKDKTITKLRSTSRRSEERRVGNETRSSWSSQHKQ